MKPNSVLVTYFQEMSKAQNKSESLNFAWIRCALNQIPLKYLLNFLNLMRTHSFPSC